MCAVYITAPFFTMYTADLTGMMARFYLTCDN